MFVCRKMKAQLSQIKKSAALLKKAESILFITGAGISADSGLPTYRGIGGLYNGEVTAEGIPIEVALSGQVLLSKPEITWKYLSEIESNCRQARFNRAHQIIAQIEKLFSRVWVLTQNIDGFHKAAGSENVIDIHGDFHCLTCIKCSYQVKVKNYSEIDIPPLCPECRNFIRPGVIFFGERLPPEKVETLYTQLNRGFDLYFSVGTTSSFPYIQEPVLLAKKSNKPVIEINPGQTEISELADIKISLRAKEAMELIWQEFNSI